MPEVHIFFISVGFSLFQDDIKKAGLTSLYVYLALGAAENEKKEIFARNKFESHSSKTRESKRTSAIFIVDRNKIVVISVPLAHINHESNRLLGETSSAIVESEKDANETREGIFSGDEIHPKIEKLRKLRIEIRNRFRALLDYSSNSICRRCFIKF